MQSSPLTSGPSPATGTPTVPPTLTAYNSLRFPPRSNSLQDHWPYDHSTNGEGPRKMWQLSALPLAYHPETIEGALCDHVPPPLDAPPIHARTGFHDPPASLSTWSTPSAALPSDPHPFTTPTDHPPDLAGSDPSAVIEREPKRIRTNQSDSTQDPPTSGNAQPSPSRAQRRQQARSSFGRDPDAAQSTGSSRKPNSTAAKAFWEARKRVVFQFDPEVTNRLRDLLKTLVESLPVDDQGRRVLDRHFRTHLDLLHQAENTSSRFSAEGQRRMSMEEETFSTYTGRDPALVNMRPIGGGEVGITAHLLSTVGLQASTFAEFLARVTNDPSQHPDELEAFLRKCEWKMSELRGSGTADLEAGAQVLENKPVLTRHDLIHFLHIIINSDIVLRWNAQEDRVEYVRLDGVAHQLSPVMTSVLAQITEEMHIIHANYNILTNYDHYLVFSIDDDASTIKVSLPFDRDPERDSFSDAKIRQCLSQITTSAAEKSRTLDVLHLSKRPLSPLEAMIAVNLAQHPRVLNWVDDEQVKALKRQRVEEDRRRKQAEQERRPFSRSAPTTDPGSGSGTGGPTNSPSSGRSRDATVPQRDAPGRRAGGPVANQAEPHLVRGFHPDDSLSEHKLDVRVSLSDDVPFTQYPGYLVDQADWDVLVKDPTVTPNSLALFATHGGEGQQQLLRLSKESDGSNESGPTSASIPSLISDSVGNDSSDIEPADLPTQCSPPTSPFGSKVLNQSAATRPVLLPQALVPSATPSKMILEVTEPISVYNTRLWDSFSATLSSSDEPDAPLDVVVKFMNPKYMGSPRYDDLDAVEAVYEEAELFARPLLPLQAAGTVPRFYGLWCGNGTYMMILEDCGDPYHKAQLTPDVCHAILDAYQSLHSAGVTHGDVRAFNILCHPVDHQPRLIDFEAASITSDLALFEREMTQVERLLGLA